MRMLRLTLECRVPLHCGSGQDDFSQDQPVVRDAFGFWRIPGSTLAGILRHHAARLAPEELVDRLFGVQKGKSSHPSLVWCADGRLLDFDGCFASAKAMDGEAVEIPCGPFIRDHVRIDLELGAAETGGKFDEEITPTGTRFALEIALDGWNRHIQDDEGELFDALSQALIQGELALGGKAGSGYGRYTVVEASCRDFDLSDPKGMEAYLNLSAGPGFGENEGVPHEYANSLLAPAGPGLWGEVTLPLQVMGPLLVAGPGGEDSTADITCLHAPVLDYAGRTCRQVKVVPGTSFKGVLRHRVYHIARALGLDPSTAEDMLNGMFGFVDGLHGQCGKISLGDACLETATRRVGVTRVQHVAIDRFTGGALEGALYDEEPIWADGLKLDARLSIEGLEDHEAALLLHALLDMAEGMLPVGGGTNRGNGVLALRHWDTDRAQALRGVKGELTWNGNALFPGTEQSWLDWIETLNAALWARVQAS